MYIIKVTQLEIQLLLLFNYSKFTSGSFDFILQYNKLYLKVKLQ